MNKKDFPEFFLGLSDTERDQLAREAKTSAVYIRDHLLGGRRLPRVSLLERLVAAAATRGERYTKEQLMACFLKASEARAGT